MRSIKIGLFVVIGLAILIGAGRCFYMVACISCTFPPIKEYEYPGNVDRFASSVQKFARTDSNFTYKFSRRDSSSTEDNGNRDCELAIHTDSGIIKYSIVCDNGTTTNVKIVSAFKNDSIGGYGMKNPKVRQFIKIFENEFINNMEREEHITLKSKE